MQLTDTLNTGFFFALDRRADRFLPPADVKDRDVMLSSLTENSTKD